MSGYEGLKARPTTYKGTQMRSRLEARFAAGLDKFGIHWVYEPRAFADESGQYLPDFELHIPQFPDMTLSQIFVEVKPTWELAEAAAPKMNVIRSSIEGAALAVVCPQFGNFVVISASEKWSTAVWVKCSDHKYTLMSLDGHSDPACAVLIADGLGRRYLGAAFDWSYR